MATHFNVYAPPKRLTDQPFIPRTFITMRLRFIISRSIFTFICLRRRDESQVNGTSRSWWEGKYFFLVERTVSERFGSATTGYKGNKEAKFNRDRQNFIIFKDLRWNRCFSSKVNDSTSFVSCEATKKNIWSVCRSCETKYHRHHDIFLIPLAHESSLSTFSHTPIVIIMHVARCSIGSDFNSSFFISFSLSLFRGFFPSMSLTLPTFDEEEVQRDFHRAKGK